MYHLTDFKLIYWDYGCAFLKPSAHIILDEGPAPLSRKKIHLPIPVKDFHCVKSSKTIPMPTIRTNPQTLGCCSFCGFLATKKELTFKALIETTFSSQKGEKTQKDQCISLPWLWVSPKTCAGNWTTHNTLVLQAKIPFLSCGRQIYWRCHMTHLLSNTKKLLPTQYRKKVSLNKKEDSGTKQ